MYLVREALEQLELHKKNQPIVEGFSLSHALSTTSDLKPHFEDVQSHYDLSDDFYRLFLDPTQTYSCAYFERDDLTLHEAQLAKIDLSLGKLGLEPGMTLLDVGCGWGGATMRRAIEKYDVNVIGLTLSRNQQAHAERAFAEMDTTRSRRVVLQGWEQFNEPVDRIVSIGAFEHFGGGPLQRVLRLRVRRPARRRRDDAALDHADPAGRDGGTRAAHHDEPAAVLQVHLGGDLPPGGHLPTRELVVELSGKAGFTTERIQSLEQHYAKTLDLWAAALEARRDEAIALQSEEVYDRYMKYLTGGCADLFRNRYTDVCQFTLTK